MIITDEREIYMEVDKMYYYRAMGIKCLCDVLDNDSNKDNMTYSDSKKELENQK